MDNNIKKIIEEKFASKAQQRYFYAKANDKSESKKERNKWKKMAKEFSDKTNFKKIPEKVSEEDEDLDEIVDEIGNIARSKKPTDAATKGVTAKRTTDDVVKTGGGSMGIHGVHGTHTSLRYWAEADMSKALGFEKTMGDDEDYDEAEDYFKDELGMDDADAEERMSQLGYDKDLAKKDADKVRLVETPKRFIEEYIDSILNKKTDVDELVDDETKEKDINPLILRQIKSLKSSLDNNNLTVKDILKYLKNNE